jgi:AraC-like DNA-binding protein
METFVFSSLEYHNMIDIEVKKTALIADLTQLLDNYDITRVYHAEHVESMLPGSNVSKCDRLAVPLSGCHRMEIFTEGEISTICPVPGTVTFMPAGIWNCPDWQLPVRTATFGFEADTTWVSLVENYNADELQSGLRIIASPLSDAGIKLLNLIKKSGINHNDQRVCLLTKALLYYCLDALLRVHDSGPQGKAYHTWYLITTYLEEHYASEISREEIGHLFKLAPNYISFLFRQQTGKSFTEYLNNLRLAKACFLLKQYNQTLDELAMAVGLNSAAYFCRLFKRSYGMTPTEYRNRDDEQA